MSAEKFKDEIQKFIDDAEENYADFSVKQIKGDTIELSIADTLSFTIVVKDEKGIFSVDTEEEGLLEWKKSVNAYCEQGPKKIFDVLVKCTDAYNELEDDEEEGNDSDGEISPTFLTGGEKMFMEDKSKEKKDPTVVVQVDEKKISKRFEKQKTKENKEAVDRLMKDYMYLLQSGSKNYGISAEPINDDLFHWEVRLSDFDKDTCKDFNNDLKAYSKISKGQDYISLDVKFPPNYPYEPPFIRVVKPRFKFRTGHVTIGGSICMELLTPAGWRPIYTLEAVLIQIKTEMSLGGARLDLSNTAPYTEREAMDAFYRVAQQHGWIKSGSYSRPGGFY